MRILITGGAGFVGSNLVRHLVAAGSYDIAVLDNLSSVPNAQVPRDVEFVKGDFTDPDTLARCLRGADAVIHLAAQTGVIDSIANPELTFDLNVAGSFRLLELARKQGVGRVVSASTGGALLGERTPPIDETMAPEPMSPYGASKMAVEGFCSAYAASFGLACASLRFSNIYGPRSAHKKSVVAAFIKGILRGEPLVVYGDGTQRRDYLFVGDLVRNIQRAIDQGVAGTYQLGSGRPTSLLDLMASLERLAGRKLDVRFEPARKGEVHSTWCSIDKAAGDFGYSAPTALDAGLRETWDWFVENQPVWSKTKVTSED